VESMASMASCTQKTGFADGDSSTISYFILWMSTQDAVRECCVLMKFNKLMSAEALIYFFPIPVVLAVLLTQFEASCTNNYIWYISPGLSLSQASGFGKP